jgi:hypothetical protein
VTAEAETFVAAITGLTPETQYFFEAEIRNGNGVTVRGNDGEDFTTLAS